jgi:hypothetical protein
MSSAGIVLNLDNVYLLWNVITQRYELFNIILFGILLLLVLIPWLKYDKFFYRYKIIINGKFIKQIKSIYIVLILLSLFCIIYCLPYAIIANTMGGEAVRTSDMVSLLPNSILTTIAAGVATLAPIGILFFFIGLLDVRLKKYSIGVLLLPFASVVHSMTLAARELYIFLPVTFIVIYTAFSNSLALRQKKIIKKFSLICGAFLVSFFMLITLSRFGEFGSESFISGSWGYLYQQPYVFDQTLQFFDNYGGFSKTLQFLGKLLGIYSVKSDLVYVTEFSFGTMYKGFYEMYGYRSLIMGSIIYILFFTIMANLSIRKKNTFSILINYSIFIWFTISGLFYFRYGKIDAQFILYLLLVLISSFYPKFLNIEKIPTDDMRKNDSIHL